MLHAYSSAPTCQKCRSNKEHSGSCSTISASGRPLEERYPHREDDAHRLLLSVTLAGVRWPHSTRGFAQAATHHRIDVVNHSSNKCRRVGRECVNCASPDQFRGTSFACQAAVTRREYRSRKISAGPDVYRQTISHLLGPRLPDAGLQVLWPDTWSGTPRDPPRSSCGSLIQRGIATSLDRRKAVCYRGKALGTNPVARPGFSFLQAVG